MLMCVKSGQKTTGTGISNKPHGRDHFYYLTKFHTSLMNEQRFLDRSDPKRKLRFISSASNDNTTTTVKTMPDESQKRELGKVAGEKHSAEKGRRPPPSTATVPG